MNRARNSCLRWSVLVGSLFLPPQSVPQTPPKDLREWQLICYCSGGNPDEIVRDDNNGQILLAARHVTTRERLKGDGIVFTESQIELLKDWRLLAEQGDQLKTQMPVVGPEEITKLRALLHIEAAELGGSLQPEFKAFVAAVTQRGYVNSAYSIVFSYLLDGMVWDEFDQRHLLPSMETTAEKPFWGGVLWALYPRRDAPGTNSKSQGGWDLSVTWTQAVQPFLTPLNSTSLVHSLLIDLETHGSASNVETRSQLAALGILTADGQPTVPIIHEVSSDSIYAASLVISHKLGDSMLQAMQSPEIRALLGTSDNGVALVIAYHEFMWELLAYLEKVGIIRPPPVLSEGAHAEPWQVHDLVFIVVSQPKQ